MIGPPDSRRLRILQALSWSFVVPGTPLLSSVRMATFLPAAVHAQEAPSVPSILIGGPGDPFLPFELERDEETGRKLSVWVSLDTMGKEVCLQWQARVDRDARWTRPSKAEGLSFHPTAFAASRTMARTFYVAGRSSVGPVLERWSLQGEVSFGVDPAPGGALRRTQLQPPSPVRTALRIDPSLGWVGDLGLHRTGPDTEEVWLLDHDARTLVSLDAQTGKARVRGRGPEFKGYHSLRFARHSLYGEVCILDGTPPLVEVDGWPLETNPPLRALYDADLDGEFEGLFFPIPSDASIGEHVLYSTGEWIR